MIIIGLSIVIIIWNIIITIAKIITVTTLTKVMMTGMMSPFLGLKNLLQIRTLELTIAQSFN